MDETNALDPDVIDLVVQLCTRIGMMMEDVSPLALEASREDLEVRGFVIANVTCTIAAIAAASRGTGQ